METYNFFKKSQNNLLQWKNTNIIKKVILAIEMVTFKEYKLKQWERKMYLKKITRISNTLRLMFAFTNDNTSHAADYGKQ